MISSALQLQGLMENLSKGNDGTMCNDQTMRDIHMCIDSIAVVWADILEQIAIDNQQVV